MYAYFSYLFFHYIETNNTQFDMIHNMKNRKTIHDTFYKLTTMVLFYMASLAFRYSTDLVSHFHKIYDL